MMPIMPIVSPPNPVGGAGTAAPGSPPNPYVGGAGTAAPGSPPNPDVGGAGTAAPAAQDGKGGFGSMGRNYLRYNLYMGEHGHHKNIFKTKPTHRCIYIYVNMSTYSCMFIAGHLWSYVGRYTEMKLPYWIHMEEFVFEDVSPFCMFNKGMSFCIKLVLFI